MLPIRVLGRCGRGSVGDVADAIVWAVGATIDGVGTNPFPSTVVMMAFVGNGLCPTFVQSSVNMAISRGAILLAAAGNDGGNSSNHLTVI
jgi:serine protease